MHFLILTHCFDSIGISDASTFAFTSGPPLHDVLTLVYLTHPHLFKGEYLNDLISHLSLA